MKRKRVTNVFSSTLPSSKRRKLDIRPEHSCDYDVYTWGDGTYGCLFHDSEDDEGLPRRIQGFDPKFDISTLQMFGNCASFIFDIDGEIYSFGMGKNGQLGHNTLENVFQPKRIVSLSSHEIVEVCGSVEGDEGDDKGWGHTLFLNANKSVFGCGDNLHWGVLGGEESDGVRRVMIPQQVKLDEAAESINCALISSGVINESKTSILCWGGNEDGVLGVGRPFNDLLKGGPQKVVGLIQKECRVEMFCMGSWHCLALTTSVKDSSDVRVWSWGLNENGQLGQGDPETDFDGPHHSTVPSAILYFDKKGLKVRKIACGGYHCALVCANGVLFMWGDNDEGQCGITSTGDGTDVSQILALPTRIQFTRDDFRMHESVHCLDICCSFNHTLAICEIQEDGEMQSWRVVYSWGDSRMGKLGHDSDINGSYEDKIVMCVTRPKEIQFFTRQQEDYSAFSIGTGNDTSLCVVEKTFYHLHDVRLQDDKLDFLEELGILPGQK